MKHISIMTILLYFSMIAIAMATDLSGYKFLKIAPKDQRAVVKTPDGKLQLIKVGDIFAGGAKVIEIAEKRILLQDQGNEGQETVIVRLDGHGQRLERYRQGALPQQVMPATVITADENLSPQK